MYRGRVIRRGWLFKLGHPDSYVPDRYVPDSDVPDSDVGCVHLRYQRSLERFHR